MGCEAGDIVKIIWQDIGANHEYTPIDTVEDLIVELRKYFTIITYGEVLYVKDNEIIITYSKMDNEARVIYLRKELIKDIIVLIPAAVH